jgi:SOS response regulatory protein OraA/RecX
VLVELDGADWRTVPAAVAARAGLSVGLELDRTRLRELARELRRGRALDAAARALARRDRGTENLRRELARRGVAPDACEQAIETLQRAGVVDDERFAHARARSLAERGAGDAAIRFELDRDGIESDLAAAAIAALEPEEERARALAAARGATVRTARYLARKGFSEASIEAAVPGLVAPGP